MKNQDFDSIKNQEIKRKFVEREVIYCASALVYELAQKAEHFRDYEDDLYGAFQGKPDYEEAATQNGWIELDDTNRTKHSALYANFYHKQNDEYSEAENWEELCEEQNIDAYEYANEICEHWIVSDYLADKLENHGHKVLRDFFGMTIWCRPTTGQAILLDGVISSICDEMEILKGQKYEWK